MHATDVLRQEHEVIRRMLDVLEEWAQRLLSSDEVPLHVFRKGLEFVRGFAQACHHAKEEHCLFPLLEGRGIAREAGPIGVMLHEHDQGREYAAAIEDAIDRCQGGHTGAKEALAAGVLGYIELLRGHIVKENDVLFPMAERVLSSQDSLALLEQFEDLCAAVGEGAHQRYEELVGQLEAELGLVAR